ncbi:heme biosynthesis protein HemY [Paracoccus aurantiacus]|uniref:Heme biosynthesis protein HemY n=1 Tax=Paracoccus aurantiacus TaxID=2599412 RepID=A0A5C6S5R4_9RHOB|nr:heme biosynthesis HemY N-terminal domain-containing protein [Paracoccus aurantiacus]TXB69846.1 heme biosynthesis protein HemY [Paracoccus aurantiacus]
MLASLLKILLFFAIILAVAVGLNTLSATSEGVRLVFNGTEYTLGPIAAVAALVLLMVVAWLLFKILGMIWAFLRFIMGDETAINRYFARSRREKGIEALSQGLLAVASGEGKQAQDMANRAAKYLDDNRATRLLAAQAAEVAGDEVKAESVYREMLEDDRTRFVGVRGLMKQKLSQGDTQTALQLAQKAYTLKPRHAEIQNTLLELSTREGDWKGARGILKDKRKQGELPQDVHIRRDAVMALQEARDVLAQGSSISAREAAISAAKASPDLVPAVVLAARTYIDQKDGRNAERLLEKAWSVRPHPDLAEAYAAVAPDETPKQRLRRFEALMKKNPDDEETRLLRAELLLANEDFPAARRALGDLAETHPTTRTLAIMAAIERGEGGSDAAVRAWLVKAMGASRGPQWVCDKCENVMEDWAPVCASCAGFDTLSWREPAHKRPVNTPAGAELLPLLIGSRKDDAVADGSAPARPGETSSAAATAAAVAAASSVDADVAPGMVPRESDYKDQDAAEPVRTITDPEVPTHPAEPPAKPEPQPTRESVDQQPTATASASAWKTRSNAPADDSPVRPDVEPPEDTPMPQSRTRPGSSARVIDPDMPVRPDVEPIDTPSGKPR